MQPIINPIFIYLLSILDGIHTIIDILIILSIFITVVPIVLIIIDYCDNCGEVEESTIQKCKPYIKKGLVAFLVFNLLNTFIPTKETAIMIYTSKLVTINNINTSKEFLLNTFQDVMNIINNTDKEENK